MLRSNDLLRPCLQALRRLTGARAISLYLPASASATAPSEVLVHDGDPPIDELADLTAARRLAERSEDRDPSVDGVGGAVLLSRGAAGGRIVRLATPPALLELLRERELGDPSPARRRSDLSQVDGSSPAIWVGLQMSDEVVPDWPPRFDQTADPAALWTWMLGLSAALAWHAQQVGTVLDDPVSKLPGRARFQASLAQAMERSKAKRQNLVLVLINPSDFVVVNENFGREAGDAVIREVGARLKSSMRSSDLIGRYGGAVFSLALLDTEEGVGEAVAEKLRRKLVEGAYLRGSVRLGFAAGLAAFDPADDQQQAASPLELFRRADRALNLAKQSPEGGIVVWRGEAGTAQVGTLDRLSGIFTANLAKDYRNMLFLWDTVNIVSRTSDFDALAARVVERLHATFKTERVALFSWSESDGLRLVGGKAKTDPAAAPGTDSGALRLGDEQRRLLRTARRGGEAVEATLGGGDHGQRFCCAVPLIARERCLGCLYVEGRDDSKTFERSDLIFLQALAGQLAVTLDRSLLAADERARQEQERRRLRNELKELRQALQETRLIYRSAEMEAVVSLLRRLAPTDATLLITGESGTGKELLARTAHELSPRNDKPWIVVDCGAIAAPLIESELFGREKGAYTGAEKSAPGRLVEADGGTVILDEIGELPLEVQTRFLRFTQEKQLTPVGGTRARKVDIRLIAVTNRDLEEEVAAGRFRADLYYRLNVARLVVPPLRERPDDILFLARHFLKKFSLQYQKGVHQIGAEAEARLLEHRWPGNVRELQNRIMRAVILCEGPEIGMTELELVRRASPAAGVEPEPRPGTGARAPYPPPTATPESMPAASIEAAWETLRQALDRQVDAVSDGEARLPLGRWLDEDLILEAYDLSRGVLKQGALLIGIPETTFRRKLRKAQTQQEAGTSPRPPARERIRPLIVSLVRSRASADIEAESSDVLRLARDLLLEQVLRRLPGDAAAGSALMGVTVPTFRRWAAEQSAAGDTGVLGQD